jgi:hypothetical protein
MFGGGAWTQIRSDQDGRCPYRVGSDWQREKQRRRRDGTVAENGPSKLGVSAYESSGDNNEGRCDVHTGG